MSRNRKILRGTCRVALCAFTAWLDRKSQLRPRHHQPSKRPWQRDDVAEIFTLRLFSLHWIPRWTRSRCATSLEPHTINACAHHGLDGLMQQPQDPNITPSPALAHLLQEAGPGQHSGGNSSRTQQREQTLTCGAVLLTARTCRMLSCHHVRYIREDRL